MGIWSFFHKKAKDFANEEKLARLTVYGLEQEIKTILSELKALPEFEQHKTKLSNLLTQLLKRVKAFLEARKKKRREFTDERMRRQVFILPIKQVLEVIRAG